jgi:virginiamycin B lyase
VVKIRKVVPIAAALALATASIVVAVETFRDEGAERVTPAGEAGSVVATIPFTSELRAIAAGEAAIWVASVHEGTVTRIDPVTNEIVATISVSEHKEGPWDVAAGEGGVWAITGTQAHPSQVVRIDPATNRVVARIDVQDASVLSAGLGSVWVSESSEGDHGALARIDPASNQVVARIPLGPEPSAIAIGGGSVWVLDDLRYTITRVDPATGTGQTIL